MNIAKFILFLMFLTALTDWTTSAQTETTVHKSFVAPGAVLEKLPGKFTFTEGPAADKNGNVYFTDYRNNRIYMWSAEGQLSVFLEDSRGLLGMDIDPKGNIIAAANIGQAVLSIDTVTKQVVVLADSYNGKRLNSPNDLWCDAKGGVYFSDPRFVAMKQPKEQEVEGVYYLSPDRKKLVRVIDDLKQPNGLTGSLDGSLLYVDDTPSNETYVYRINPDGTLSGKKLFAKVGYDGMTVDSEGNVYITATGVDIYSPSGEKLDNIPVPERPTNISFGGKDGKTLFITTIPNIYMIRMNVSGKR